MLNVPSLLSRLVPAAAALGLLISPASRTLAQSGSLDPNFNPGAGSLPLQNGAAFPGSVFSLSVQSNGLTVLGGNFFNVGDLRRNFVARLNVDGTLDGAFNTAGLGFDNLVRATALQTDGRVLVGGLFSTYDRQRANRITRLNTDGTLDTAFTGAGTATNTADGPNGDVRAVALQNNGQILIGGFFTTISATSGTGAMATVNVTPANRLARLNAADGTQDNTFNVGSGADDAVETIATTTDANGNPLIYVGGAFANFNGAPRRGIARLTANGALDPTFNPGIGFNTPVRAITVLANGQVLVGGDFTSFNGNVRGGIVRLNMNGTIDATFNAGNAGTDGSVRAILVAANGQIYLGGDFSSVNGTARGRLARLNPDGTLDAAFAPPAGGANAAVRSLAFDSTGLLLVGGDFSTYAGITALSVAQVNLDGTSNADATTGATFASRSGGVGFRLGEVDALALTSNNKVLAGGNFTAIGGAARLGVARLNPDGSVDAGFNTPAALDFNVTRAVATRPNFSSGGAAAGDDFSFVGGDFNVSNGTDSSANFFARLLPGGSIDPATISIVTPATGNPFPTQNDFPDGPVRAIAAQPVATTASNTSTDTLIVGGDFNNYFTGTGNTSVSRPGVARVSATAGVLDQSFNANLGAGSSVRALAVQPANGAVVIGGDFARANGTSRLFLARVNADGTTDTSFNPGAGPDRSVEALAVNPTDGKIYVGGTFTSFSGQRVNRAALVRLNADGTVDSTFSAVLPTGSAVRALVVQPDGKVIAGGDFVTVSGVARNNLARLNLDGTLDQSFGQGTPAFGADGSVRALALKPNGRVVVGGAFNNVNNVFRPRLAQLNGDQAPGTFAFSDLAFSVSQSATTVTVTVVRQGGASGAATVNFATVDGTAKAGVDYVATSGTLFFAAGVTTPQTFTVTLLSPPNPADNRTFNVVLSSPTGDTALGAPSVATVRITVAAPGIFSFASASTSVREDAGSAVFVVTRANGSAGQVTLTYLTSDGTNSRGRYTPTSGSVTFGDGDLAPKLIRIPVIDNKLLDGNATVNLTLLPPTGAPVVAGGSATATLTIIDDEAAASSLPTTFQFATVNFSAFESDGTATITVTRAGGPSAAFSASNGSVSVRYVVSDLTARLGVNYANSLANPNTGILTWSANDFTPKTFNVALVRDNLATGNLNVGLALTDPQSLFDANGNVVIPASLGSPNQATLSVVDVDLPAILQFTQNLYQTFEDSGAAVVTVVRTGGTGTAVAVNYSTGGGSAAAGSRYTATSGTLSWPAGDSTSRTIVIPILQDNVTEPDQTVGLALGQIQGNALLGPQATATLLITDDDGGQYFPILSVDALAPAEATTDGAVKGFFTITRRNRFAEETNTDLPLTVSYRVSGTALNGQEYKFLPGTAVIPAGADSVRIKVKAINNGGDHMSSVKLTLNGMPNSYYINSGAMKAKVKIVFPENFTP